MRLEIPGAFDSKTDVHRDRTKTYLKKAEKKRRKKKRRESARCITLTLVRQPTVDKCNDVSSAVDGAFLKKGLVNERNKTAHCLLLFTSNGKTSMSNDGVEITKRKKQQPMCIS